MAAMHFSRFSLSHPSDMARIPVSEYCVYEVSTPYTQPCFSRNTLFNIEFIAGPPNMLLINTVAILSFSS